VDLDNIKDGAPGDPGTMEMGGGKCHTSYEENCGIQDSEDTWDKPENEETYGLRYAYHWRCCQEPLPCRGIEVPPISGLYAT
jgi:hypothetical protein